VTPVLNLDPAKLLVIAVVAVVLLGPDRLPQVARQVGAAWKSFNEFRHRIETDVRKSVPDLPSSHDIARLARSPSALLNHLSNMATDGVETTTMSANAAAKPSSDAEGNRDDADGHASGSSEAASPDIESPSPRTPVAVPKAPVPVVVISDPHLN
jgi:TatA/E family protein of Tat protein translocase